MRARAAPSSGRSMLPPSCPLGRVRDEVDLHLGVGADDRPDVAALDDGVADVREPALMLDA